VLNAEISMYTQGVSAPKAVNNAQSSVDQTIAGYNSRL
jgi:hypothetical protein